MKSKLCTLELLNNLFSLLLVVAYGFVDYEDRRDAEVRLFYIIVF